MSSVTALDNARLRKDLQETELLLQIAEEETAAAQRSLAAVTAENSELKAKVAALEAALAAAKAAPAEGLGEDDDSDSDSDWDCCSCMTPEMCRGGCCTSEDFKEWSTEEKAKGVDHRRPVRDFKKALKDSWGLERRIQQCEMELKAAKEHYQTVLMSGPDFNGWERLCSNAEDEVRQMEEWMDHLLSLRDKKME